MSMAEHTLKSKLVLSPHENSELIGVIVLLMLANAPGLQSSPKGFFFFFSFLLHSFLEKVPISHSPAISAKEESIHSSSENEHPFPNDLLPTCSLTAFLIWTGWSAFPNSRKRRLKKKKIQKKAVYGTDFSQFW